MNKIFMNNNCIIFINITEHNKSSINHHINNRKTNK